MNLEFGKKVYEQALKLQEQGKDANQIAKILCDQDKEGHNYGIGIVLDGNGQPMATSSTLLEYTAAELELSKSGKYMNSNAIMEELKKAVLMWQRIPEKYWKHFQFVLPSDAGTGAVKTGVDIALMLDSRISTLGIGELSWPAYKAIARVSRIQCEEYPPDGIITGESVLPLYQAGPMNTLGFVSGKETIEARAKSAAENNTPVVLDRAYSGFEYARLLENHSFDEIMQRSYEQQIRPFIEQSVTFFLAVSPTKSFISFALRPCGFLLLFCPDLSREKELTALLNSTVRARGSAFEHPATRALAKAMTGDLSRLEAEHKTTLERVARAEATWRKLARGTQIEYLYSENYAGIFRNPGAREDAQVHIYNEHIYPVFTNRLCRQNITGIPDDEELARKHVSVFAGQCS